jgi:hypothetical protein
MSLLLYFSNTFFTHIVTQYIYIFIQQIQSFFAPICKPAPATDGGGCGINASFLLPIIAGSVA